MSARERAVAAVEAALLDAALSHADRAGKLVRSIEEAGLTVVEMRPGEAEMIACQIESHANIADRPGQHDELRELARRVRDLTP